MIEVDESQLTLDDLNFPKLWANALRVSVAVLFDRIVPWAALHGEHHAENFSTAPTAQIEGRGRYRALGGMRGSPLLC